MPESLTDRFARWGPSGTRAILLLGAGVVVLLVACVLVAVGVDSVETVATLLVAVVFGAALLAGRTAGLVAAALATGAYIVLRRPDMDATGAANFGLLVTTRAVAYVVVALAGDRAARLVEGLGRGQGERGAPLPIERPVPAGRALAPLPVGAGVGAGGFGGPATEWGTGPAAGDRWDDVPHPSDWRVGPSALPPDDPEASPWTGPTVSDAPAGEGEWEPEGYAEPYAEQYAEPYTDQYAEQYAEPYDGPSPGDARIDTGALERWMQESDAPAEPQPWAAPAEPGGRPDLAGAAAPGPADLAEPWPPADDPWGPRPGPQQPEPAAAAEMWDAWAPDEPEPPPVPAVGQAWDTGQRPQVEASYVDTGQAPVVRGWSDPALEPDPEPAGGWPGPAGDAGYGGDDRDPWAQVAPAPPWDGPDPFRSTLPAVASGPGVPPPAAMPVVDPDTRLWSARYLCDRLAVEQRQAVEQGRPFSLVLVQVPDGPLAALSHRRQVTLLRELGHQFVAAGVVDHLVHVPDEVQHWFAVVLPDTGAGTAGGFERRLREGIGGYLRSRGLLLGELQSACLTSPDDDEVMGAIWETLIARGDPGAAPALANDR